MTLADSLLARFDEETSTLEAQWHLPWSAHRPDESIWAHPAITQLWNLPEQDLLATVQALASHSSFALRGVAIHLIGDLGIQPALCRVRDALDDSSIHVRATAVRALATIRDDESLERLLDTKDGEHSEVKKGVLIALRALGDTRSIPLITRWVGRAGEDDELRELAAMTLGALKDDAGMPVLSRLLKDPAISPRVRCAAAHALGQIGTKEGWELISATILKEDTAQPVVEACLRALGPLGEKEALPLIHRFATAEAEDSTFAAAIEGWIPLEEGPALEHAKSAWAGRSPEGRLLVAEALGRAGCRAAAELLLEGLADTESTVAAACLVGLHQRTGRDFGYHPPAPPEPLDEGKLAAAVAEAQRVMG